MTEYHCDIDQQKVAAMPARRERDYATRDVVYPRDTRKELP